MASRTRKFIVQSTDDRLPQFSKEVQELVQKGRQQGFITQPELLKAMPKVEEDLVLLDEIYALFLDLGIDVMDPKESDSLIWKKDEEAKVVDEALKSVEVAPKKPKQ